LATPLDAIEIGEALKLHSCQLIDSLVHKDLDRSESEFASLAARVQELVERKRAMEGSKADTRDLIAELTFSRLRRAMHLFQQSEDEIEEQRAAEWVMGALLSMTTLSEIAQTFDRVLLQSTHSNQDFNFASRTDFLSLEEVLQMLGAGKHTGCMSLEKADNRLDIYLCEGRVASLDPHHMIRRLIPAADVLHQREIPAADLAEAEELRSANGRSVLLHLMDRGHFPHDEPREVLHKFGREVLLDFMIASEPFVFFFRRLQDLPESAVEHDMRIGVTSLLLEASKGLDDWHQMQRLFPDPDAPIEPCADMFARMGDTALDVLQLKLLSQINGEVSARGLVPVLGVPLFDVYELLVQLADKVIIAASGGEVAATGLQLSVEESM